MGVLIPLSDVLGFLWMSLYHVIIWLLKEDVRMERGSLKGEGSINISAVVQSGLNGDEEETGLYMLYKRFLDAVVRGLFPEGEQ